MSIETHSQEETFGKIIWLAIRNGTVAAAICFFALLLVLGAFGGNDPFPMGGKLALLAALVVWVVATLLSWVAMHIWFRLPRQKADNSPPSLDQD